MKCYAAVKRYVDKFLFNPDGTTTQTTYFYDEQGNTVDVFQRILDENDNVIG